MSVDEELAYPRDPVYTAKEYDELKAEAEKILDFLEIFGYLEQFDEWRKDANTRDS